MQTRPARVEVMDVVDRWLHGGAVIGGLTALGTGPLLRLPPLAAGWGLDYGWLAGFHGAAGALCGLVWLLHLVRVCLSWLEGASPTGLLPRGGDAADLLRGVAWNLGLVRTPPEGRRFGYRERLPYGAFLALLPLLLASGWLVGHPALGAQFLGGTGVLAAATAHAVLGASCVPLLIWHLFFAHLQPGVLYWNNAWLTGRMSWEQVEAVWPQWATSLLGEFRPAQGSETDVRSVESFLAEGNEAARQGRYEEAARLYRQAIELYPGYSQALFNLGVVLDRAGDRTGASDVMRRFLREDPFGPMAPRAREILDRAEGG